ncbi:DEAD-domain-containing protein [Testicularia cyperi]|uniref:RNA helicase n=1 Tax=Testicularia cyperi TaxID=1882483 RepID=A0A317XJJ0_9BASI|nr:DEAD-domain-containing protein [Testicularia cyperi]
MAESSSSSSSPSSSSKVVADSLAPQPAPPRAIRPASSSKNSAASHGITLPTQEEAEKLGFNIFAHLLDSRVLRSLADLGFGIPTPIQQKAVPLALGGKDVLARARTGSGKTLAYALPILQKIIHAKSTVSSSDPAYQQTRALVLVPTRELAEQVFLHISAVNTYTRDDVKIANVARDSNDKVQKLLLSEKPDIVIATPSKALAYLQNGALDLRNSLESLAIDEADLILSYGHDANTRSLLSGNFLPSHFQTFLMSATMTQDVDKLKGLLLRNPVILKLSEEDDADASNLTQFYTRATEDEKFLLVYVILKLKLIRGKAILFVNEVERGYRLKLFLEKFGLRACVLNAELPINSRYSIVEEFNKGRFDYIVATDEPTGVSSLDEEESEDLEDNEDGPDGPEQTNIGNRSDSEQADDAQADGKKRKKSTASETTSSKKSRRDQKLKRSGGGGGQSGEFGVSRGVDFVNVSCVINFDMPTSITSYIHRVGRTARGGASGTSLSFVVPSESYGKSKYLTCATTRGDERLLRKLKKSQPSLQEWKYDSSSVDGFRYRVGDTVKSITRALIKEARIKELKTEILNSSKLQSHFEDHPDDLSYLKHDKSLLDSRAQQHHLKHVPQYLVPKIIGATGEKLQSSAASKPSGYIAKNKAKNGNGKSRSSSNKNNNKKTSSGFKSKSKKKVDPLRKFTK